MSSGSQNPRLKGVCIGAGYFSHFQYEAWQRIPEVEIVEFTNGAIGQWDANRYNEPACPLPEARYTFGEFLVEGSAGSLRLHLDGRITLKKLGGAETDVNYAHDRRGFAGDCVYATQRHFTDRLLDGKPFETSGEDYLITTAVQEAVYQSAERRAPVEIGL